MQRNGRTEANAEQNLIKALKSKLAEGTDADLLSPTSSVSELADKWLEELRLKKTVAGTFNTYRNSIQSRIKPGIGSLRLNEASVPRVDRFIKSMLATPAIARTARTVMLQMFALAVRQGAIGKNPVTETMPVPAVKNVVKVIAINHIHRMRELFAAYDETHTSELSEISMLIMSTGARTGEGLAPRWEQDVALDRGLLRICGTLSTDPDTGKLFRQDHPKSEAGQRGLMLPATAVQMLTERRINAHFEMVFPSSTGTYRWPANTRRHWREALKGSPYVGKTPRDFRKAIATHLDQTLGIKAAQSQLGHESEEITTTYYLERAEQVSDFAEVIETMFQSNG